jgi:hypothetical protein
MLDSPDARKTVTISETDLRKPNFWGGLPIRLGDGQAWAFVGPRELAEVGEAFRVEVVMLLLEIAEAEDAADRMRGELALAIHLLSLNYDLSPGDLWRLLAEVYQEARYAELQAGFSDLARRHAEAIWRTTRTPSENQGRRYRFPRFRRTTRTDQQEQSRIRHAC